MKTGDIIVAIRNPSGILDYHIMIIVDKCYTALITVYETELIDYERYKYVYDRYHIHECKTVPKIAALQDIYKVLKGKQIVRPEYKEKLAEYVISLMEKENV